MHPKVDCNPRTRAREYGMPVSIIVLLPTADLALGYSKFLLRHVHAENNGKVCIPWRRSAEWWDEEGKIHKVGPEIAS
jgi:hypothetical protein